MQATFSHTQSLIKRESKFETYDLQAVGCMPELWALLEGDENIFILQTPWRLKKLEEKQVKSCIGAFKTPIGCMR